jgi:hypothetical protein
VQKVGGGCEEAGVSVEAGAVVPVGLVPSVVAPTMVVTTVRVKKVGRLRKVSVAAPTVVTATQLAHGFSLEDMQALREVRGSSVRKGTWETYERALLLWMEFLGARRSTDRWLESCGTTELRQLWVSMFIVWLQRKKGRRQQSISATLGALKGMFSICDKGLVLDAFEEQSRTVRGTRQSKAEQVLALEKKVSTAPLGICRDMIDAGRAVWWTGKPWDTASIVDRKAAYMAVRIGYNSGLRVSNLTAPQGTDEDNCIREHHVMTRVVGSDGVKMVLKGTVAFATWYSNQEWDMGVPCGPLRHRDHVIDVVVSVLADKTDSAAAGHGVAKGIDRCASGSEDLLEEFIEWMVHSGGRAGERLFARRVAVGRATPSSKRELTRKDITTAIQGMAKLCGLPPTRFSSKSMRIGFATDMHGACVPSADINTQGGWAPRSTVAEEYYCRQVSFGGAYNLPTGWTTLAQLHEAIGRTTIGVDSVAKGASRTAAGEDRQINDTDGKCC